MTGHLEAITNTLRMILLTTAALSVAACAGTPQIGTTGIFKPDGRYVLSAREQKLSCQKLAGTVQIKIAVLKDYNQRVRPSLAAQAGQAAFSHSQYASQPEVERRQQLARTVALNDQLKAKGCQGYDIDAELARNPDQ